MKKMTFLIALLASFPVFAGLVPRINCVGSIYDKEILDKQEVQEEKVLLEFRTGGAAFSDTFLGYLKEYTFIVVINKSLPISNLESVPLQLGIYNSEDGKTLIAKNTYLFPNGPMAKIEAKDQNRILTLSCTRLFNP